ncbi:MAG: alpha/beta fold hydrolase [Opitutae bacterium]|nr:alpha/beta fold hydrolase [Opitutae bacterium]
MLVPGTRSLASSEHVILLHGLARTSRSMRPMAKALQAAGYVVHNIDYPSRGAPIEELAVRAIASAVADCGKAGASRIHFVTHSLGGILVRQYLATHRLPALGRVVMLGPPNQGSEVVDRLGPWRLFSALNGPAGRQLGTGAGSVPNRLGPATCPVGVIAGRQSINWINSLLIPGTDDGKVSVERTRLAGMTDHLVLPCSHPFLMRDPAAIRHTLHFLAHGRFQAVPKTGSARPTR